MEFDNSFEVPLPPDEAWPLLMDIRRIAPCMPGAELTEVVDDKTYKGKIAVRLGTEITASFLLQWSRPRRDGRAGAWRHTRNSRGLRRHRPSQARSRAGRG